MRRNIDRIDRELVALLVERGAYVLQAARFKRDAGEVRAPERAAQVIANARRLAAELGGDPAVAERVFREVVAAFTDAELSAHRRVSGAGARGPKIKR